MRCAFRGVTLFSVLTAWFPVCIRILNRQIPGITEGSMIIGALVQQLFEILFYFATIAMQLVCIFKFLYVSNES